MGRPLFVDMRLVQKYITEVEYCHQLLLRSHKWLRVLLNEQQAGRLSKRGVGVKANTIRELLEDIDAELLEGK